MTTDDKRKEKIEKLESKVEAAKKKLAIERQKQKKDDRKIETRKKILIGSYFLEMYERKNEMDDLLKRMNAHLKRDHDRAVFGLDPLPKEEISK